MRRACAVLLFWVPASALWIAPGARADGADSADTAPTDTVTLPVPIELEDCSELDERELRKLLAIEFDTLNIARAQPGERVLVRCAASGARVTFEPGHGQAEVAFSGTASAARARLLALTVSELVGDAPAHGTRAKPPAPPRAPRPVPTPAPSARSEQPPESANATSRVRVSAGGALRYMARPRAALWGPQLALELTLSRHFSLAAEGRLELGKTSTQFAQVRWISERASLVALYRAAAAGFELGAGPGACLGRLSLSPSTVVAGGIGHEVSGAWAGPELVVHMRRDLGRVLFVLASVEGGVTTMPVRANASDGRELVDSGGIFFSATLGLGAAL